MLELLTNTYILPAIIAVLGTLAIYIYYRITKQTEDYTTKDYARYFIIIYICGLITLMTFSYATKFISSLSSSSSSSSLQSGGSGSNNNSCNIENFNSHNSTDMNGGGGSSISFNVDRFQTGRPTF